MQWLIVKLIIGSLTLLGLGVSGFLNFLVRSELHGPQSPPLPFLRFVFVLTNNYDGKKLKLSLTLTTYHTLSILFMIQHLHYTVSALMVSWATICFPLNHGTRDLITCLNSALLNRRFVWNMICFALWLESKRCHIQWPISAFKCIGW